ncbi:MAG: glutathione S-transferase family protein [Dinoroseobacter sp.]|nr:glutathione S-transferase family protein [Dinoroseobacter sp.]MDJ0995274.1 glutathione S-transferase family protein [Dinoroseobacter sp.]
MKLLSSPASPFGRKVRALLAETGHADHVALQDVTAAAIGPVDDILIAANPAGKLPTLIRPDGPALYDSRVICRYLNDTFDLGMYPDHGKFEMLTLEATADAIMDAGIQMVYERRLRPDEIVFEEYLEGQWRKITRTLDALEARWMSNLSGPVDMSHIALGCALGYLDFRLDARNWREGRPALAAWAEAFLDRPAMVATAPEG